MEPYKLHITLWIITNINYPQYSTTLQYIHCKRTFVILTIAVSSELQPVDSYYNINKSLILSCSSKVIYRYHLTGKWTGTPGGRMDNRIDNGMYSWWHHCVLDSFIPSFKILKNRHWR